MRTAYITSGVLLLGLLQSSCSEKPHFTIRLTNLDDNIETVYVNAALDGPARGASSSSELTFDLKSYNAKGSFDFGLSFDVPPSEEDSQRTGTVDIALVGGGCIRKIIRTAVQGPTGLGAPTVRELNMQSPSNFDIVPLVERTARRTASWCCMAGDSSKAARQRLCSLRSDRPDSTARPPPRYVRPGRRRRWPKRKAHR